MARIDEGTKRQRKERVQLIVVSANGLREAEIAALTGLEPRTTNNYLRELEHEGQVHKQGLLWYGFDIHKTKLRSFELSPEEAYTLYLAARLLVKQQDKRNEPAETALLKLAKVLSSDLGVGSEIAQAATELAQRLVKTGYQSIFRTVVQGYLYRRKIDLVYRPYSGRPFPTVFSPYLLEPSAIGFTTYAIGHSSAPDALRSYRLDRIEAAQLAQGAYTIPHDFPGLEILRNSWSIIIGETTTRVVLRFSTAVRERVLETRWHPSQAWCDDPDKPGCLRWWVEVADTTDMKPWIRSWGADCEVLEPEGLRNKLKQEVRKMTQVYQISASGPTQPPQWLLWGKTNRPTNDRLHLLICHLVDVGNVAQEMWRHVFTDGFKRQVSQAFGLSPNDTGRLIAFLAASHDLGKACPSFQEKLRTKEKLAKHYQAIIDAGFDLTIVGESCPHGFVSTFALQTLLQDRLQMSPNMAMKVAVAIGGHHGRWPTTSEWKEQGPCAGKEKWNEARVALFEDLRQIFEPPGVAELAAPPPEAENMLLVALSGITSVVDWLGSMENPFGYVETLEDLREYAADSAYKAGMVLEREGWREWYPPHEAWTFSELFEHKTPRQSQEHIIGLALHLNAPSLVIIEDATGSGKTESALYLADHWTRILGNRGAYVAMPTMATSNQMYDRFNKVLEARYRNNQIKAILVHSQARLAINEPERKIQSNSENGSSNDVNALAWFEDHRKRSLLTPFGVGTVDQTFLSVLQTNHFFVKLFALGRKTIIFDEVHAYDTYMTTIFQTLLQWLHAMGSSVVILSATLPVATRQRLVDAYGGDASNAGNTNWSSLVTWVSGDTTDQSELPATERPPVSMEWIGHKPDEIAQRLRNEVDSGGCVAVICNRVARAQEVYHAVKKELKDDPRFVPGDNLILFHARFPQIWRDEREKQVRRVAERDSIRDRPFIIVATQVIEQSLDLDFDLIVTDLPPMDLLIQRIGRLHRHREHDETRPQNMKVPRVLITKPEQAGETPKFGLDERLGSRGGVYARYIMLRTYLELKHREQSDAIIFALPAQSRELIEAVYAGESRVPDFSIFTADQQQALKQSWKQMRRGEETDRRKASLRTIEEPQEQLIYMDSLELTDDDSPQAQAGLNAITRLCLPTIQLVCLVGKPSGLLLLDDKQTAVDLEQKPKRELARRLAWCAVSVTRPSVVEHFVSQKAPVGWQEHAVLKHFRAASFTEQPDGSLLCRLTNDLSLRLTKERGIEI